MKYILASKSPRRKEILSTFIQDFDIVSPDIDELFSSNKTIEENLLDISYKKASVVAVSYMDSVVIAADTVVVYDNKVFGKPISEKDALEMLLSLNGKSHFVFTAVSLIHGCNHISFIEKTKVFFRNVPKSSLISYIKTGEPLDKAGAYAIQGVGSFIVERIEGDYFNVVGLPIGKLINTMINNNLYNF